MSAEATQLPAELSTAPVDELRRNRDEWQAQAMNLTERVALAEFHLGQILAAVRIHSVAEAIERARSAYGKTLEAGRRQRAAKIKRGGT